MSRAEPAPEAACPICGDPKPRFACRALLHPGRVREILDCAGCGAAFYWPPPTPEEIARCYPHAYFSGFFRDYWKEYYKGRSLARSLSRWKESGRLLDVGCAVGNLLAGVRDHSRWEALGLEYTPAAAAMGREFNRVEIASGGLGTAPWPAGSFDYVHINNVLEHEADPAGALAAAGRLLAPGGRLHLVVPNGPVDLRPNRTLYRRWGRPVHTRHGGHLFFLPRQALELLLKRSGLRPLFIRSFGLRAAMKARGWLPGSYKKFRLEPELPPAREGPALVSLEEYRALIPPRINWGWYYLRQRWRRLWRWRRPGWGYDFEILAEKAGRPKKSISAPPTENSSPRRGDEFPTPSPEGRASVPSEGDLSSHKKPGLRA